MRKWLCWLGWHKLKYFPHYWMDPFIKYGYNARVHPHKCIYCNFEDELIGIWEPGTYNE